MNNNSTIIAVAIVAAAVILKFPIASAPGGPAAGRYQIVAGGNSFIRVDTVTGDAWQWMGYGNAWQPNISNGARP